MAFAFKMIINRFIRIKSSITSFTIEWIIIFMVFIKMIYIFFFCIKFLFIMITYIEIFWLLNFSCLLSSSTSMSSNNFFSCLLNSSRLFNSSCLFNSSRLFNSSCFFNSSCLFNSSFLFLSNSSLFLFSNISFSFISLNKNSFLFSLLLFLNLTSFSILFFHAYHNNEHSLLQQSQMFFHILYI